MAASGFSHFQPDIHTSSLARGYGTLERNERDFNPTLKDAKGYSIHKAFRPRFLSSPSMLYLLEPYTEKKRNRKQYSTAGTP